jgi:hypothetical protein
MICQYFYRGVEVIDNKYITNIHCNLWSKHDDINEMLEVMNRKYGGLKYTKDVLKGIDFELPKKKAK